MSEATGLLQGALKAQLGRNATILRLVEEGTRVSLLAALAARDWVVTNRFDLHGALGRRGFERVEFSDFEIEGVPDASLDGVAFRVSKDKVLTHALINESAPKLRKGGRLFLAGMRNEGIKTYIEKASRLLSGQSNIRTTPSGARVGAIERGGELGEKLEDRRYREWRQIDLGEGIRAWSKPGIFGWDKLDAGSKVLAECLPDLSGKSVLDLGCGYGYLALRALRGGAGRIVATDSNAAALAACKRNLNTEKNAHCEVLPSNAAREIGERFDVVLCNPPFHSGKATDRSLSKKFARAAMSRLQPGGEAFFVVNAFIPMDEALRQREGAEVEMFREAQGFRALRARADQR